MIIHRLTMIIVVLVVSLRGEILAKDHEGIGLNHPSSSILCPNISADYYLYRFSKLCADYDSYLTHKIDHLSHIKAEKEQSLEQIQSMYDPKTYDELSLVKDLSSLNPSQEATYENLTQTRYSIKVLISSLTLIDVKLRFLEEQRKHLNIIIKVFDILRNRILVRARDDFSLSQRSAQGYNH